MAPKVSVITPVYNVERYLERCLDSILGQTISGPELELICVDDGSTDSSPDILARYAAVHPNLRVLRRKNGGPSLARNDALDAATGEYIFFVDSDDWLLRPDVLEALYTQASAQQLDELFFDFDVKYDLAAPDAGEAVRAVDRSVDRHCTRKGSYPDVLDGPSMYVLLCHNRDSKSTIWSRIYRRAFLEENRLRFYPGIIHQDEVFTLECMSLERRTGYRNMACYGYHMHPGSIYRSSKPGFSARCYLLGARALQRFEAERLSGVDPKFRSLFHWRVRVLANMAADQYYSLPKEDRRGVLDGLAPQEQSRMRRMLRGGLLRIRTRKLRVKLHVGLYKR